jgi:hypothetical protein
MFLYKNYVPCGRSLSDVGKGKNLHLFPTLHVGKWVSRNYFLFQVHGPDHQLFVEN